MFLVSVHKRIDKINSSLDYLHELPDLSNTAGGSGTDVGLYDLRMAGRSSSQAVQKYRPRPLRRKSSVSISGIEASRNNKELLVAVSFYLA